MSSGNVIKQSITLPECISPKVYNYILCSVGVIQVQNKCFLSP